jgi:hypothetical protein
VERIRYSDIPQEVSEKLDRKMKMGHLSRLKWERFDTTIPLWYVSIGIQHRVDALNVTFIKKYVDRLRPAYFNYSVPSIEQRR